MDKLKVETKQMLLQPMPDREIEEMMAEMPAGYMSAPLCSFTKGRQKRYNLNNRHRKYTVRQTETHGSS